MGSWLVIFGIAPAVVGRRGPRIGWRRGRPSAVNRFGVVPIAVGAAGLGWCLAAHVAPGETMPVSLVPEKLIAEGPYRFSRNPMYVCEQSILFGWVLYFGSPALAAGAAALGAGMRYAVQREERTLADRFGASWQDYSSAVRRWL